jgi:hypothetical protein
VQQLTPQAASEVQQGMYVLHSLQVAIQQHQARLAGFVQWAAEYHAQVQQAVQVCQGRTYSAADNASAGCVNYDTAASCEGKLLDWCMNRNARFKPIRDDRVRQLKDTALQLQGVVTQRADRVYPE